MSSAAAPPTTTKALATDLPQGAPPKDQKPPTALEEDDEFEDFPVDDWPASENEVPSSSSAAEQTGDVNATTHLWEESWDDDDTSEDFSKVLGAELEKVKAKK